MPQIFKSKKLFYTPKQMFDLVADIESYPEFLPWCARARLIERNENEIIGSITAQKGGFNKSFTTRNHYDYPNWMSISLLEGPFKHLQGRWEFKSLPEGGCEVSYQMDFSTPFFLAPFLAPLMEHMGNTMVDSFAKRADSVYQGKINDA
ncbi:type II toxin-antitoxin system RatA family toxin [Rappaport israeli]|uniref:type II toxin-antitoxin system RatA family toxin n=1 Tax=Rappaport israeli TaxID=1839807 RepID=UPI000ADCFC3F|nr:type II toxin-antitoxin system RatA family toxin [Rappaport israeli]